MISILTLLKPTLRKIQINNMITKKAKANNKIKMMIKVNK